MTTAPRKARPVVTPHGEYPSLSAAGRAYGITKQAVWHRCRFNVAGWRYHDHRGPLRGTSPRGGATERTTPLAR